MQNLQHNELLSSFSHAKQCKSLPSVASRNNKAASTTSKPVRALHLHAVSFVPSTLVCFPTTLAIAGVGTPWRATVRAMASALAFSGCNYIAAVIKIIKCSLTFSSNSSSIFYPLKGKCLFYHFIWCIRRRNRNILTIEFCVVTRPNK